MSTLASSCAAARPASSAADRVDDVRECMRPPGEGAPMPREAVRPRPKTRLLLERTSTGAPLGPPPPPPGAVTVLRCPELIAGLSLFGSGLV